MTALGLALLLLFTCLYVWDMPAYQALLRAWMIHPFPRPFIDWEVQPAAAECWAKGINVYEGIPCYTPVSVRYNYSPLWLRFGFLPTGDTATVISGLLLAVLFFASLAYLPPARNRKTLVLTVLVTFSSLTAFAIERGNADLLMFVLSLAGVALWLQTLPLRLFGYGLFVVAGLLKFYPLVLLVLLLREKPRVFFPVAAAAAIILAGFMLLFRSELVAMSRNIPAGYDFSSFFGAINLPRGLPVFGSYLMRKLGAGSAQIGSTFQTWLTPLCFGSLIIVNLSGAAWLAARGGVSQALVSLPPRAAGLLVAGAAVMCGCFYAGQSIGYRGIFLLLTLPGLFRLKCRLTAMSARAVGLAVYAIVFVAWEPTIHFVLIHYGMIDEDNAATGGAGFLHWVVQELAWWWIVGALLSTVFAFVLKSNMGAWALHPWAADASRISESRDSASMWSQR